MKKRYVALIAGIFTVMILIVAFVGLFGYEVKASGNFLVIVTRFGAVPIPDCSDSWSIHIQQLNLIKLEDVTIIIDKTTTVPFNSNYFTSQKQFGISWHPSNITIVWNGGVDFFYF
jgi:hypothetical protein